MSKRPEKSNDILMVDDEKAEAVLFKRYLENTQPQKGFTFFDSGAAFLDYMSRVKNKEVSFPCVVLLDIRMPAMSGFEVLEKLRQDPDFAARPLIMMYSNSKDDADIEKALALGANDYKTKPCGKEEYIEFVNSLTVHPGAH